MTRTRTAAALAAGRRARQELGRLKRRSRRAVRTGAVAARLVARRRRWRGMYVLATGGELASLPDDMLARIRRAAASGAPVEVLVLDHSVDAAPPALPDGVTVRRFWDDAAPGDGAYAPAIALTGAASAAPEARLAGTGTATAPVPGPDGGWMTGSYRDGLPVLAVRAGVAGTRVVHFGPAGRPVRRDEIDERGSLVRVVDLHASDGAEVGHRYLDRSGACWLSVAGDGPAARALRHLPSPAEYRSLTAAQAEWAAGRAAAAVRPAVVSAGEESRAVERQVRRMVLTRS